ncbi:uncharacterized protein MONBRDRAFT_24471 [Monosiga brevicollis MX1]|uniref:Uncharacterized protein n=1 Tax=Monosiga brevicollis TaxID=81824 RepID=A9UWI2_MONBE|nr:uncharacterized protein MONBRDRAFT_24471 [Monosiga brevicollis MX1]EDQ90050.1 predicted protein [Monosiga brevicollis MX1]|eukprot:XP_001744817.1 hypothetical protein [Monosiga brevicollis MX1]
MEGTTLLGLVFTMAVAAVLAVLLRRRGAKAEAQAQAEAEAVRAQQEQEEAEAAAKANKAKAEKDAKNKAKAKVAAAKHVDPPQLLTLLKGHTGPVTDVVFSPSGQHLASCSEDRTLRMWRLADFAEKEHGYVRTNIDLDHGDAIAFSTDGKVCAVILHMAQQVQLFKVSKKDVSPLATLPEHPTTSAGPLRHVGVAVNDNAKYVMLSYEKELIEIYHPRGNKLQELRTLTSTNYHAAVSPCGQFFAYSGFTPDVKICVAVGANGNYVNGAKAMTLAGLSTGVVHFTFSPDSSRMAALCKDGLWKLYDIAVRWKSNEDTHELSSGQAELVGQRGFVAIDPQGGSVVVASGNHLQIFSASSGKLLRHIPDIFAKGHATALSFSQLGDCFAVGGSGRHIAVFQNVQGYEERLRQLEAKLSRESDSNAQERMQQLCTDLRRQLQTWRSGP